MSFDEYKVSVPEGSSGAWAVERFEVTKEGADFHNMECMFSPGMGRRTIRPGVYTKLTRNGSVIMSDTQAEVFDHLCAIRYATGHVLINGLGIGMVLQAVGRKPNVSRVTVVELSADVLKLVQPHYAEMFGPKVEFIQADALTFKPQKGVRYGAVWHDIWDGICSDNLPQMHALHRKYGRRAEWQGSWCRALCELRA